MNGTNSINPVYIQGYADSITGIINSILIPVLIAIAFGVFLWGIYKYFIQGADSEDARKTGRTFAFSGIIGFVIIFSVWGIVHIFMGTLGLGPANAPPFPTIGGKSLSPSGSNALFPRSGPGSIGPGGSNTGSSGSSSFIPTQAQAMDQLSRAYNDYQQCSDARGSSDPACQQYLATYTNLSNSSGGNATCGTFFTSVCAPGSTCVLGFCSSIDPDSGGEGDQCNGSSSVCMQGLVCSTGGVCVPVADSGAAEGDRCLGDSSCMEGLVCDLSIGTCVPDTAYLENNGCDRGDGSEGSVCCDSNYCGSGLSCDNGYCVADTSSDSGSSSVSGQYCNENSYTDQCPGSWCSVDDPSTGDGTCY